MAGNWKTLLIAPQRRIITDLKPLLSQHMPTAQVTELGSYPPRNTVADVLATHRPTLCFLDMVSDQDRAMNLITELLAVNSELAIVALLPSNDPDFILRCLRRGAIEFLQQPFTDDQLQPVVERITKHRSQASVSSDARIYCVMPAKGACGASTIAFNLAYQIRKRNTSRVLLADLDPLTGTTAFLVKMKAQYSFLDVLSHSHHLDNDLWKSLVPTVQGVDVLLSPDNLVQGITDLKDPTPILTFARQAYDSIVIDTTSVYGDWSLSLARQCDELLLVTTNELPALQATQRALGYLDQNQVDRSKIRLVLNRFKSDAGLSQDVVGTALGLDVFHSSPSDFEAVNRALLDGKAVPGASPFGKSMSQLAERLSNHHKPAAAMAAAAGDANDPFASMTLPPPPPKKSGGLSGLFSRFTR